MNISRNSEETKRNPRESNASYCSKRIVRALAAVAMWLAIRIVLNTRGCSTSQLYGLLAATCGAGSLISSCALTFWI